MTRGKILLRSHAHQQFYKVGITWFTIGFMEDTILVYARGGKTAPVVVHVVENTHMLLGRGVGCANVHVNLRHMHMLHQVLVGGWGVLTFMLTCVTCTCYIRSWWAGWGVLTFMLTCVTCTCYIRSWWAGWGVLTFMLTCVTCTCYIRSWWGGWGVLTFMLTCVTCTCYVTSWVGVGCVNVHANLRHMHTLHQVLVGGWGVLTFMLTCVTCTCYVTSWVGVGSGVLTFMSTCVTCTC